MKEKVNWKAIVVSLSVIIIGILLVLLDLFIAKTSSNVWISIGCSLIASGMFLFLSTVLLERRKYDPLDDWKILKIYSTRAERNTEADPNIDQARYCIDGVAFGLSSFRTMYGGKIEHCLRKGINIRLLTMDPNGNYIKDREIEELTVEGSIKQTIDDLVSWADTLNCKNYKGKIVVKAYSCMTLDYYWRVDDELYIGPYWYGYKSSDTITYKFASGGKGFQHYSEYFESLWNNTGLVKPLTQLQDIRIKRRKN